MVRTCEHDVDNLQSIRNQHRITISVIRDRPRNILKVDDILALCNLWSGVMEWSLGVEPWSGVLEWNGVRF